MAYWESEKWFYIIGQAPFGAKEILGYLETGHGFGFPPDQPYWELCEKD